MLGYKYVNSTETLQRIFFAQNVSTLNSNLIHITSRFPAAAFHKHFQINGKHLSYLQSEMTSDYFLQLNLGLLQLYHKNAKIELSYVGCP